MMYAQPHDVQVDDSWFVAFGPGDVRTLSLEQLDDAYRLDVINDETLVCSTTMNTWVPLGVVAGVRGDTVHAAAVGGDHAAARDHFMPNSLAPAAFDVAPIQYSSSPPRGPGLPMVFAVVALCGGLLVAHRADQLSHLAGSIGMKAQYSALVARVVGDPDITTLAGTQALLDHLNTMYHLDDLHALAKRYEMLSPAAHPSAPEVNPVAAHPAVPTQAEQTPAQAGSTQTTGPQSDHASAPIDIASLPPAPVVPQGPAASESTHSAVKPAAITSPGRTQASPSPVKTSQTLDVLAMQEAQDRSRAKHKRTRFDKSAEYDPLRGLTP
jgi:uncharacterized protein YkwD